MLNVENILKHVEMLKNIGTKINFLTHKLFFLDEEFKKSLLTPIFTNIYSHLY